MGRSRKPLWPSGHRGFESHTFRHPALCRAAGQHAAVPARSRPSTKSAPNRVTRWTGERLLGAYALTVASPAVAHQPFVYSDAMMHGLVSTITSERFATYLRSAGDELSAIQLYAWNAAVSAAFYGPLQTLEVTLRNAVHHVMAANHGPFWFDQGRLLRNFEANAVSKAKERIQRLGVQFTPGRVVAELSFGFWVALFANVYDTSLWRADLHRIFRPRVKERQNLHGSLDRLRTLRNRVAHHEPIFHRNLSDDYSRIRDILGLLSASSLDWLDHHSRVLDVLGTQPKNTVSF